MTDSIASRFAYASMSGQLCLDDPSSKEESQQNPTSNTAPTQTLTPHRYVDLSAIKGTELRPASARQTGQDQTHPGVSSPPLLQSRRAYPSRCYYPRLYSVFAFFITALPVAAIGLIVTKTTSIPKLPVHLFLIPVELVFGGTVAYRVYQRSSKKLLDAQTAAVLAYNEDARRNPVYNGL